ncbi:DUF6456 domain-containing protein [Marivita sp. S6314]|uniref:DUF6456 domain-containing protein n=1 Tax=Marivita sp. S6314 TaxID=2926406 RepID=UPI001FF344F9|nr:DUF6456 domain-containing protein [Marivita sp. S6314]MCK0148622.1 DUF6456 domain-containing protein [Marivita sp. S6314]
MTELRHVKTRDAFDALLPEAARRYLAHVSEGKAIREIARLEGCHASTVMRQVRKLEAMRDDPLLDQAFSEMEPVSDTPDVTPAALDAACEALRHLSQPGSLLLYNQNLPQPAIVRIQGEGDTRVVSTLDTGLAAAFILRDWVAEEGGTTVKRYRVTKEGRRQLPALMAARECRATQQGAAAADGLDAALPDRRMRNRSLSNGPGFESPMVALSRRKGPDGQPFLPQDFVTAGDRLHEDYAVAEFQQADLLGWDSPEALDRHYAKARQDHNIRRGEAIERTLDAIKDLGPGLSDVVLRCCCLREGLEATEKRLGWSARSGKVVLRIALQRLSLFYAKNRAAKAALIG